MSQGPFHTGELAVQRQAGVAAMASRIGNGIHDTIPPAAVAFLAERSWVVLASTDAQGRPWASVVSGARGFATVLVGIEGESVQLAAQPLEGDPLRENLSESRHIGMLAIDLATRRRMRVNGRLVTAGERAIVVAVDQAYSNCPKYIQRRIAQAPASRREPGAAVTRAATLNPAQCEWIRSADTFFVGTTNPGEGADASHRGGAPGFVEVSGNLVRWPDYQGNMMFNTLGNIMASGRAGLLFPDFETGGALLLTGRARIDWSRRSAASERSVDLEVEEVVELAGVFPEKLEFLDYSPHLPPTS